MTERNECDGVVAVVDEYNHSVLPPDLLPTIQAKYPVPKHGPRIVVSEYELSDAMKRYIVSKDDKYVVGKTVLNPTIARSITTREGSTRADASSYISPDCPDDCEIVAGEDGYPVRKDDNMSRKDFRITSREGADDIVVGRISAPSYNEMTGRVHSPDGVAPTVRTFCGGGQETKIDVTLLDGFDEEKSNGIATSIPAEPSSNPNHSDSTPKRLRIRKLTPEECYRLMGFEASDTEACRKAGQSDASIFHQAGDSIVTTVLCGIFGELLNIDYRKAIEEYTKKLHEETLK